MKSMKKKKWWSKLSKGFAVSGLLYPILILVAFVIVQMLVLLGTRKMVLDQNRNQLIDSLNNSNKVYTNEELTTLITEVLNTRLDKTYPIGSIYITTTNSNPTTALGGTWVAYGQGRTLVGVGSGTDSNSSTKNFTAGSTGGEYTHKLTVSEIPAHSHQLNRPHWYIADSASTGGIGTIYGTTGTTTSRYMDSASIASTGGNGFHNNIQPYISVYMWKRTA